MKPSPFTIHRPTTVAQTLELLGEYGHHGKIIAGGQSLVPVLNMRLASPEHLIDITAVEGLDGLSVVNGDVEVGALVTHARLAADPGAFAAQPVLRAALECVAHPAIRNRGTTVGSLAHADPNGEMPMILALTGGSVRALSTRGERIMTPADFNVGPLETSLEADELIVSATFGGLESGQRADFQELTRRSGDYALAGVGMVLSTDAEEAAPKERAGVTEGPVTEGREDGAPASPASVHGPLGPRATVAVPASAGTITGLRAGFVSVTDLPEILDLTPVVAGTPLAAASEVVAKIAQAVRDFIDPVGDIHATADYRRHLAGVIAGRVFTGLAGTEASSKGAA